MVLTVMVDVRLHELEEEIADHIEHIGERIVRIGQALIEAKSLLPHGQWLAWLDSRSETKLWGMSQRRANYLMACARAFEGKVMPFESFTATALYVLSGADEIVIDSAIMLAGEGEKIDEKTAKILRDAPAPLRDRYVNREVTKDQAAGLTEAIKSVQSPIVRQLAETRVTDPKVVPLLETMAEKDPEALDVLAATGYLQGTEVIKAENLTARDIIRHEEDTRIQKIIQEREESREVILNGQKAVVAAFVTNNHVTLKFDKLPQGLLMMGDVVHVTVERRFNVAIAT